jgi:uncharacterized protein YdcH (DUF465 family)
MHIRNHHVHHELLEKSYEYRKLFGEHEKVEQSLHQMRATPAVTPEIIHGLKRHKLHLRDQMTQIERRHH